MLTRPVELDARVEVGEHRELPVAVQIGARHPNNRREDILRCTTAPPTSAPTRCHARSFERRSNNAYTASAQNDAHRVGDHVFPRCVARKRPLDHLAEESRADADHARRAHRAARPANRGSVAQRRTARRASRGRTAACARRSRWCGRHRSAGSAAARTAARPRQHEQDEQVEQSAGHSLSILRA